MYKTKNNNNKKKRTMMDMMDSSARLNSCHDFKKWADFFDLLVF